MITWFNVEFAPLVVSVALPLSVFLVMRGQVDRARQRTRQLRTAARMFDIHMHATRSVMESPRASARVKGSLLDFCDAIYSRDVFLSFVEWMDTPEFLGQRSRGAAAFDKDMATLRCESEDLARDYETALKAGFMAMLLRHDKASMIADVAPMMADRRAELEVLARALSESRKRSKRRHHIGESIAAIA